MNASPTRKKCLRSGNMFCTIVDLIFFVLKVCFICNKTFQFNFVFQFLLKMANSRLKVEFKLCNSIVFSNVGSRDTLCISFKIMYVLYIEFQVEKGFCESCARKVFWV